MTPKKKMKSVRKVGADEVIVSTESLLKIFWMARRYADGRHTYAPSVFNDVYAGLVRRNPEAFRKEKPDDVVKCWPWAMDGSPTIDARPFFHEEIEQLIREISPRRGK